MVLCYKHLTAKYQQLSPLTPSLCELWRGRKDECRKRIWQAPEVSLIYPCSKLALGKGVPCTYLEKKVKIAKRKFAICKKLIFFTKIISLERGMKLIFFLFWRKLPRKVIKVGKLIQPPSKTNPLKQGRAGAVLCFSQMLFC